MNAPAATSSAEVGPITFSEHLSQVIAIAKEHHVALFDEQSPQNVSYRALVGRVIEMIPSSPMAAAKISQMHGFSDVRVALEARAKDPQCSYGKEAQRALDGFYKPEVSFPTDTFQEQIRRTLPQLRD